LAPVNEIVLDYYKGVHTGWQLKGRVLETKQQRLTGKGSEGEREVEEGRRIKGNKKRTGGRDEMRKERTHMKE
jgi:hypothetical protein